MLSFHYSMLINFERKGKHPSSEWVCEASVWALLLLRSSVCVCVCVCVCVSEWDRTGTVISHRGIHFSGFTSVSPFPPHLPLPPPHFSSSLMLYSCCDVGQSRRGEHLKIRRRVACVWMSTGGSSCVFVCLRVSSCVLFCDPFIVRVSGCLPRESCCCSIRRSEAEEMKIETAQMSPQGGCGSQSGSGCSPAPASLSWLDWGWRSNWSSSHWNELKTQNHLLE